MKSVFPNNSSNSKFVIFLVVGGIVAGLGTLGWLSYPQGWMTNSQTKSTEDKQSQSLTATALEGQNPQQLSRVAAIGYLEPKGEVRSLSAPIGPDGKGGRIEKLLVKEGDVVRSGQIIAILDNYATVDSKVKIAQSQLRTAQAKLMQVQAGAKQGQISAQKARLSGVVSELEGQIDIQNATIQRISAELAGEKIAQEKFIEKLEIEYSNASSECQRYQSLFEQGGTSASEYDRICLVPKQLERELAEAQANLQRIVSSRQEELAEARANLSRTVQTLNDQQNQNQGTLDEISEVREVDVAVAEAQVQEAQAQLRQAQAEFNLTKIISPTDGQVLKIYTYPGERINDKGILDIGRTQAMYVRAEVYETDILNVKKGQRAYISSPALSSNLEGIVESVGHQIGRRDILDNDPVADIDARVVEVNIRLLEESQNEIDLSRLTNLKTRVIIETSP
ncbi:HlyD family efflux transporter periplasmic adaptor subunit [Synechocystis salina LEGE 06155]|uniref:DevB family protein n=1 Tax=Synechocystis salina LEGE 06155 TaxID=945782 RepID=A0A0K1SB52_9SYNC|nr:DevB family protein [Synechocystis salina LEGE 06155]MBE9175732.1 HlyD family efflux transporter periplasmic adaptor subunit [Synechocystis salina LEGE 06155]